MPTQKNVFIFNARRKFGWFINFHTGFFVCACVCESECVSVCECEKCATGKRVNFQVSKHVLPLRHHFKCIHTFNSIQWRHIRVVWMRRRHSTPPAHRELEPLVIHTAQRQRRFCALNVINNLRWKSKPDFWFSFFIFAHISSTRVCRL